MFRRWFSKDISIALTPDGFVSTITHYLSWPWVIRLRSRQHRNVMLPGNENGQRTKQFAGRVSVDSMKQRASAAPSHLH